MSINPNNPRGTAYSTVGPADGGLADTRQFGDVQVSTGRQSAYLTIELILYLLVSIGIFITAAVIDEGDSGQGFGASEACRKESFDRTSQRRSTSTRSKGSGTTSAAATHIRRISHSSSRSIFRQRQLHKEYFRV